MLQLVCVCVCFSRCCFKPLLEEQKATKLKLKVYDPCLEPQTQTKKSLWHQDEAVSQKVRNTARRRSEVKWRGRRVDYLFYPSNVLYSPSARALSLHQMTRSDTSPHWAMTASIIPLQAKKMYLQRRTASLKCWQIETVSSIIKLHIREWKSNALIRTKRFSIFSTVSEIMPSAVIVAQRALKSRPHVKETYR